jgi:hypothetical protein
MDKLSKPNKMEINVDIERNVLKVNSHQISLDKLRDFILSHWYPLAWKYRIKPIHSEGNVLFTFDWNRIFAIAVGGVVVIEEFLRVEGIIKPKTYKQRFLFDENYE